MSDVRLQIDGREIVASEGMTVLDACLQAGIPIPTLCYHEALEPFGACRLCIVEVEVRGWSRLVVSCVYTVAEGLIVRTSTEKINKHRKTLLELQLAHAPHSAVLQELAEEYGADANRYEKEASFCIHCGLCVRYCAEVVKKDAIGFIDRGTGKEISFIPEIAMKECDSCKACFPLCPTSYLQAAYVLVESLAR